MKKTAEQKIDVLVDGFNRLDERVSRLDAKVSGMDAKLSGLDATVDKLVVTVVDMKEYMQTELATKRELHDVKTELLSHIDGFVK